MKNKLHLNLIAAFAVFMSCSVRAADADDLAERKKLVGVWKGYAVEGAGEQPDRGPVKLTVTITMEEISAVQDDKKDLGAGTFKLDPTTAPAQLDGTYVRGQVPKGTYQGIYKLEGDTLKWCTGMPRKERPAGFRTFKGQFLMILKRAPEAPAQ